MRKISTLPFLLFCLKYIKNQLILANETSKMLVVEELS